ncbi:MAG: hypothetical protein ACRDNK_16890 [Solirubrobacteraceae bacterium]
MRLQRNLADEVDSTLPEVIEVWVIDDVMASVDHLEHGFLDVALELSHPRLVEHTTIGCWAAGARDGVAVQALRWHRGHAELARQLATRLQGIPGMSESCASLYGLDCLAMPRLVNPLELSGGDSTREVIRVLVNGENPTRLALLRLMGQMAEQVGIELVPVLVPWAAMDDAILGDEADASIVTRWSSSLDVAFFGEPNEDTGLPIVPLTLHPEMSAAGRDYAAIDLIARNPIPVTRWRTNLQAAALSRVGGKIAPASLA